MNALHIVMIGMPVHGHMKPGTCRYSRSSSRGHRVAVTTRPDSHHPTSQGTCEDPPGIAPAGQGLPFETGTSSYRLAHARATRAASS
jgi:hypothetical protein